MESPLGKSFREHLQKFTESTSIHGILYIFQWKLHWFARFIWKVIFCFMLALNFYQCEQNIKQYLTFETKVTTTMEYVKNMEFPSMTFCSEYFLKSSQIGNATMIGMILAGVLANSMKEFSDMASTAGKTCRSNNQSPTTELLNNDEANLFRNSTKMLELMRTGVTDFRVDVVKCWWLNVEMDCKDVLLNVMSDVQYCFTFNFGNDAANMTKLSGGNGLNLSKYDESIYKVQNSATSQFKMLINTNQSENCGASAIKRGSGYFAMISEKNNIPSSMFSKPIFLSPGYVHNVILKLRRYRRYTEHLGRCTNSVKSFVIKDIDLKKHKYKQYVCFAECLAWKMLAECHCIAPHFMVFRDIGFVNRDKLNISEKSFDVCQQNGLMCMRDILNTQLLAKDPLLLCPQCKTSCFEDKFDFFVSSSLITRQRLKQDIQTSLADKYPNDKALRENFIYVSFGFESAYVEVLEEKQAMFLSDLFIYLGGNIGLFLGMSFMSVFEILVELMLHGIVFCFCVIFPFSTWTRVRVISFAFVF